MIWNAGELPPDGTVAKLKDKHPSQPFNPDVANVFFRAGKIEAWGRGIARILEACDAASLPEPDIRHEPTGLWFEFHFSEQQMGEVPKKLPKKLPKKKYWLCYGPILQ